MKLLEFTYHIAISFIFGMIGFIIIVTLIKPIPSKYKYEIRGDNKVIYADSFEIKDDTLIVKNSNGTTVKIGEYWNIQKN